MTAADTAPEMLRQRTGSRYGHTVAATPRKTPQRTVAVEKDVWDAFGEAADSVGTDRPTVLRQFIAWYIRKPGVPAPQRPTRDA